MASNSMERVFEARGEASGPAPALRRSFALLWGLIAPPSFEPDTEKLYRERQNQRALPAARIALLAAPLIALCFLLWDYWLSPASLPQTLPIRIGFSFFCVVLWSSTFRSSVRKRITWVLVALAVCADITLVTLLHFIPGAMLFGLTGFAFPQMTSTVTPNARFTAFIGALMLVIVNASSLLVGVDPKVVVNDNFLLGFLCLLTYISAYCNEQRSRRLFELEMHLEDQATTDDLSGAYNRRHFIQCAGVELDRATRYARPTALLMLDIDNFKRINDTFGHDAGDRVIGLTAQVCRDVLRTVDSLGRVGGEEFAIMLPETDLALAHQVAERLRESVQQHPFSAADEKHGAQALTVSIGVAFFAAGESIEALMKRADTALYEAKRQGRNRVVVGEG